MAEPYDPWQVKVLLWVSKAMMYVAIAVIIIPGGIGWLFQEWAWHCRRNLWDKQPDRDKWERWWWRNRFGKE